MVDSLCLHFMRREESRFIFTTGVSPHKAESLASLTPLKVKPWNQKKGFLVSSPMMWMSLSHTLPMVSDGQQLNFWLVHFSSTSWSEGVSHDSPSSLASSSDNSHFNYQLKVNHEIKGLVSWRMGLLSMGIINSRWK